MHRPPRERRRPMTALKALLVAAGLAVVLAGCGSSPASVSETTADRVLVVSLPGVGWEDTQRYDLPNLERFVDDAAIAQVSTRIGRRNASPTDAYLTLGAGTRAVAPDQDTGVALDTGDPQDSYGGVPASDILMRRLGYVPDGIAYVASGAAANANETSGFDAEIGLLGEVLAEAGLGRAVIANADAAEGFGGPDRPPEGYYVRSAATAVMEPDGTVPAGDVSRSLLASDPAAPFGLRLDHDAVMSTFRETWEEALPNDRGLVLVEASDINRAVSYRQRATPEQYEALRAAALRQADDLLGELLEVVDLSSDAVVVISPVSPTRTPELGLVAIQSPSSQPGLLQSPVTRRDGYVNLADITPTLAELLGEELPTTVEGRAVQVGETEVQDRVGYLVDSADAAAFRDSFLPAAVTGIIVLIAVVTAAAVWRDRLPSRLRSAARWLALAILGLVPGSFVVALVPAARTALGWQLLVLAACAVAVAFAAVLADRLRPGSAAVVAVGLPVGLITVDLLTGANLQVNTLFGYSMAVAGRYTGLGNLAYALFGAASIVLAALLVDRYRTRGWQLACGLLAGALLVDGLPMLGADVGGVVSLAPAFGVTLLLLAGLHIGSREVLGLGGATVAVVFLFGAIDSARSPAEQTHLARVIDHAVTGNWDVLFTTVTRRWQASFGGVELAGWATVAALMGGAGAYALVCQRRARTAVDRNGLERDRPTPLTAAVAGLVVLGVIGLVANDSSLAVPLTMLIVAVPILDLRLLELAPATLAVGGNPRPSLERDGRERVLQ